EREHRPRLRAVRNEDWDGERGIRSRRHFDRAISLVAARGARSADGEGLGGGDRGDEEKSEGSHDARLWPVTPLIRPSGTFSRREKDLARRDPSLSGRVADGVRGVSLEITRRDRSPSGGIRANLSVIRTSRTAECLRTLRGVRPMRRRVSMDSLLKLARM